MKLIATKSIQKKTSSKDGIRICIMRRIKPEFGFDIWLPRLAPSTQLLKEYLEQTIPYELFQKKFLKELAKQQNFLELILFLAEKEPVTLLCWEESAEFCHRTIVTEQLKKIAPEVTILHR